MQESKTKISHAENQNQIQAQFLERLPTMGQQSQGKFTEPNRCGPLLRVEVIESGVIICTHVRCRNKRLSGT